jgi:hypothetical protein
VICADELGPVIPRAFPPAPGWSPGGHRVKAPLEYSLGPEKTRVYGGLRIADGQEVTMCAPSRNSEHYQRCIRHAFIPKGACWLNLQEGWWRIFRRQALAGQDFADLGEIARATRVATAQLNARARPWVWGRPQPKHRSYRRRFVYIL